MPLTIESAPSPRYERLALARKEPNMKYILPITAIILIFAGCREHHDSHHAHPDNHIETDELQLTLNDGQRWKMDDHTRAMFKAMTERIEAGGDINVVGKGLKSDLDKLIQGCTMTGEAHNQLHAFLIPFIPAVQEFSANASVESLQEVEELLQEYPKYFE